MSSRAAVPSLDRTFIPRRLRRSHDQPVGNAAVSPMGAVQGEFPQFPQALCQSASEMHPEKRQQNAGLSLAEIHLHEETLPSVRSFAVSPKGCTPKP
jgi:hypothetical protein